VEVVESTINSTEKGMMGKKKERKKERKRK